jgi:hypothetical protein
MPIVSPLDRYAVAVRELMMPDDGEARRAWFEALIEREESRTAGTLLLALALVAGAVLPLAAVWFSASHFMNIGTSHIDRRFGLLLSFALFGGSCLIGTGVFLVVFPAGASLLYRVRRRS